MNRFLNAVEIGAPEAIYLTLQLPLRRSSRAVEFISTLKYFVNLKSHNEKTVLLHHPLNNAEYGNYFLKSLNRILKIPIISWTQWHEFSDGSDTKYNPIPFSLAPNKNTKGLRKSDSISSLLEVDLFLFNLIKILSIMP